MNKQYEVTGPQPVYGHHNGDVVELDLDDVQEQWLVEAGHIKPIAAKKAASKTKES